MTLSENQSLAERTSYWDSLDITALRQQGSFKWSLFPDCLGAFIAEMDFGVAAPVREAIKACAEREICGYLPIPLSHQLQEACAGYMRRRFNWSPEPDSIGIIQDVLRAYELVLTEFIPADWPIVIPTPCYAPFLDIAALKKRTVIQVPCRYDSEGIGYLDEEGIADALNTTGGLLILCSPNNPLGRVYTHEELIRISSIVNKTNSRVFADEVHAPLSYPGNTHIPYASISHEAAEHTITATSASKSWNIPGLACAQIIFSNKSDLNLFNSLGHYITRGASTVGVMASIAAYDKGQQWLNEVINYLDNNRRVLKELLSQLIPEARIVLPQAGYLAWIDLRKLTTDKEIGSKIRDQVKLAVVNGAECGKAGEGFIRINFATPTPVLKIMIERLAGFFN